DEDQARSGTTTDGRSGFARHRRAECGGSRAVGARDGVPDSTRRISKDGDSAVEWKPLRISRLHEMLKNPVYADVYAYGRRREKKMLVDGQIRRVRPDTRDPERWLVKIEDAHPGYITWQRYVQNQERLRQNMTRMGDPRRGAPREGPALLMRSLGGR